ncbi:MAG: hypothetical protein HYV18_01325 [Gammaproteobacteria bacterium]|nr:hypothetical protein [Gammaproteobacteria bacterium]
MRKTLFAAGLSLFVGAAAAAAQDEQAPEARAYLSFSFGGAPSQDRSLHYGLRMDHSRQAEQSDLPAVFQYDLSQRGSSVRLNGVELFRKSYRLGQSEEEVPAGEEGAPLEEEGGSWFGGVVDGVSNFFANLFGGDSEEEAAAEEGADAQAGGEGLFANYETIDYVMLGAAAIGLGYLAAESLSGDDSATPASDDDGNPPPCTPQPICEILPYRETRIGTVAGLTAPEYQEWLDGGTGQMGDLGE